jgi:hypothetical protein
MSPTLPTLGSAAVRAGVALSMLAGSLLAGCAGGAGGGKDGGGVIYVESEDEPREVVEVSYSLTLAVESPEVVAGEPVSFELVLVGSDGSTELVEGELTSDQEELYWNAEGQPLPSVAGEHELSARVWHDDAWLTDTGTVFVNPAGLAELDLRLDDLGFIAGDSVGFAVLGWDAFGNPLDGLSPELVVDSELISIGASSVSGTVPGAYLMTATVDTFTDAEVFAITPAGAAAVTLTLSDEDLELFETTSASVEVTDAYGNPTVDSWALTVTEASGLPDTHVISYNNITFWSEGVYTVRVDVDDTSLWDEVGPLVIDSTGPVLDIEDPDRGDWNDGLDGSLSGTVSDAHTGVTAVEVDGTAVTVESDGSFTAELSYESGVNIVETTAVDGDGNLSTDTRAVLAGDFLVDGDPVQDGFVIRLSQGNGGLDTIESLAENLVSDIDLTALIPNPVVDLKEESCIDLGWFGEYCFTWYAVRLTVGSPSFGDVEMDLDPRAGGTLLGTFTIEDIYLSWNANATVAEVGFSGSGDITADDIYVDMSFQPQVSSYVLDMNLQSVSAGTTSFYFDMDGWLYDALSFFGLDGVISSTIESYLVSTIEDLVESEVPPLLEDTLQTLELSFDLPLQGRTYAVDAAPSDVLVNTAALQLSLATWVEVDSWQKSITGLGSLYEDFQPYEPTTTVTGTKLSISLDFLNQLFYQVWGGGVLDMALSGDEMGLDVSELSFLLPGLTELNITTEALLPPVIVPDGTDALAELQLGDLLLTLYNGDATPGNEMIQVYVSAFIEMDVTVDSAGTTLTPELGDMELFFDVVYPASNSIGASDTEQLLELLVPLLIPSLTDVLGEIQVPEIEGFGLTGVSLELGGPSTRPGMLDLEGNLSE